MVLRVYFSMLLPVPPCLPPFFILFRAILAAKIHRKAFVFSRLANSVIARRTGVNREIFRVNREIILPDKGRNREITGQDRFKHDWASFRPNPAARNVA
jgi:hypothetical protein